MKPVRLAALAVDDLRDAIDWYEEQQPALGARFAGHVDALLQVVSEEPQLFPVVHLDVRRALVRLFPYGVFFREESDSVRVVGIIHLHRSPAIWRKRR